MIFKRMEYFKYAWLTFIGFVMTLEDKDIIQVDATVIIGVMILLKLSIGFDSSIISQKDQNITRLMIT
jgi:predicted tellurium resistance membrane protein TerC